MIREAHLDWSTINLDVLQKLPRQILPATFHLQQDCGNGCAGDPPGFPTYFTRSVYSASGNSPPRSWPGYETVILKGGVCYGVMSNKWKEGDTWEMRRERFLDLCKRLWVRPAIDHPRTVAWIQATFRHHHNCYQNPEIDGNWSDKSFIYPVPDYKLEYFHDDERFSAKWRKQAKAAVRTKNAEVRKAAKRLATFDNHAAVVLIRRYYPEFAPSKSERAELLAANFPSPGNWWEKMAERPTPETCPGQYGTPHPVNGSWCQMCGYEVVQE